MALPTTIPDVLVELDTIIKECRDRQSPLAYFAFVYRKTTARVLQGIEQGIFEDNGRMALFDVAFANLYLQAYWDFSAGKPVTNVWRVAFEAMDSQLTIAQHIVLGMNAHINYDLALSAAQLMKDEDIQPLKSDFQRINGILFSLTNELQELLSKVSPLFFLVDWMGKNRDEQLINFSMERARALSWKNTVMLWSLDQVQIEDGRLTLEDAVSAFAKRIKAPKSKITRWLLKAVAGFEKKDVRRVLDIFSERL